MQSEEDTPEEDGVSEEDIGLSKSDALELIAPLSLLPTISESALGKYQKELELEEKKLDLAHKADSFRQKKIQWYLKNAVSVFLVVSGMYFFYLGKDPIGFFLSGNGIAGIGIRTTDILTGGKTNNSQKDEKSEK